ncbi:MvaB: hydroxymehtylglutaryl-CoA lyase [Desulfosarcina variabilis str. Montpellier]|uniref:hydroxymethylglutaryl-CoA lyase n=1 Tax=Desulfosarcina variabilis TaxID=2300 RepID=UPI003AFB28E8
MQIVEVGPRDGLQNETAPIPTAAKITFINALSVSGVGEIEVSAFVSPRWVPQLSDATEVLAGITRQPGVVYSVLVPNRQGLEQALAARVDKVSVFTAASETFNRKNINTTIEGSIRRFQPVVAQARDAGLPVRGYVSTAFWCAFEGKIEPQAVLDVVDRLVDIGIDEVAISDTIGKATPDEVKRLLDLLAGRLPVSRIAGHFHDTYGRGVDNVLAAWSAGIRTIDASVGGLGGCPYAPGASGNVATDDVVAALEKQGIATGVDRQRLAEAFDILRPFRVDDRRTLPADGSPACAACQFSTGKVCCKRYQAGN